MVSFSGLDHRAAFECDLVGLFDGAEASGNAGFAVGDSLAVTAAVGAFGQVLGVELDFAEVGFAFLGVGGDGVDGDVRGGGVHDESDGLAVGVVVGQNSHPGPACVLLGLPRAATGTAPDPVSGISEHKVGAVELVAGGAEAVSDRAGVGAGDGVAQQAGGLGVVGVGGGAGVAAELVLKVALDGAGVDEAGQALGERRLLRAGGQPDGQPTGGDMVDGAVLGVGDRGSFVDKPFVQGQVREELAGRDTPIVG